MRITQPWIAIRYLASFQLAQGRVGPLYSTMVVSYTVRLMDLPTPNPNPQSDDAGLFRSRVQATRSGLVCSNTFECVQSAVLQTLLLDCTSNLPQPAQLVVRNAGSCSPTTFLKRNTFSSPLRTGMRNLLFSRCSGTAIPILPHHSVNWLGLMEAQVQKQLVHPSLFLEAHLRGNAICIWKKVPHETKGTCCQTSVVEIA